MISSFAEENIDFEQESQSLLSSKMKVIQQKQRLSNCLASIKAPLSDQGSRTVQTCQFDQSNRTKEIDTASLKTPYKPTRYSVQSVKAMTSKKNQMKQQYFLSKSSSLKLFEVHGQNEGLRRIHMKQIKARKINNFSGRGVLVLPHGKKYEGQWVDGKMIGKAKITYPNCDIYEGQVYNYYRHGKGVLHFSEGKYVGEFSGQDFHGFGSLFDQNGLLVYQGLWRRGQRYDK